MLFIVAVARSNKSSVHQCQSEIGNPDYSLISNMMTIPLKIDGIQQRHHLLCPILRSLKWIDSC